MPRVLLVGVLAIIGQTPPASSGDTSLVDAILTAYEANRASLSSFGTIEYRVAQGKVAEGSASSNDELSRADWKREAVIDALYVFDGPNARHDHVYPAEQILARRRKVSDRSWVSDLFSFKKLTNGTSSLIVNFDVSADDKSVLFGPTLNDGIVGEKEFDILLDIPLWPGRRAPADLNLAYDIQRAKKDRSDWTLKALEEDCQIDGISVVKLDFQRSGYASAPRIQYWVDLEHGAIPLRIREDLGNDERSIQLDFSDIHRVGDRGWIPFRQLTFIGVLPPGGRPRVESVREIVIQKADFEHRPDRSVFVLELPEARAIVNGSTFRKYPARKVWDLEALSPAAAAQAQPVTVAASAAEPVMPGERETTPTWAILLMILGAVLILITSLLAYRRWRRA